MSTFTHHEDDISTVLDKQEGQVKPPPMYKVLMHNDDYTPMDFVVKVLRQFFNKSLEQAEQIMLKIHHEGIGNCGVFTKDVAETKVVQVLNYADEHQHPLKCTTEEVPE